MGGGGGGEGEGWRWWAAAGAAQAAAGASWSRRIRRADGGAAEAMPLKALGVATLYVGAAATVAAAGLLAAGIGSVEEMKGVGARIRRWMGAPPREATSATSTTTTRG